MKILVHICCSSCALYPVKITREERHDFTGFWFNPNIQPYEEYELRLNSLKALADKWHIDMIYAEYTETLLPDFHYQTLIFRKDAKGNKTESKTPSPVIARDEVPKQSNWIGAGSPKDEILRFAQNDRSEGARNDKKVVFSKELPQRPERCKSCYKMRLEKTAEEAQKQGFDAFSTTLLISPYQDFEQLISIGSELAEKHNVIFYFRDFRQYFREAMAYAKEMGLYRQKYCGCIYSREERFRKGEKNSKSEVLNRFK